MNLQLEHFGVNMTGCRYNVYPCGPKYPDAERVLKSEPGLLLTEKRELKNLFILPIESEWVFVETIN